MDVGGGGAGPEGILGAGRLGAGPRDATPLTGGSPDFPAGRYGAPLLTGRFKPGPRKTNKYLYRRVEISK